MTHQDQPGNAWPSGYWSVPDDILRDALAKADLTATAEPHPLNAAGYAIPTYLQPNLMAGYIPVSRELLTDDTPPSPTPLSLRERLTSWWWNTRQTVGERIAGRTFDEGDDW